MTTYFCLKFTLKHIIPTKDISGHLRISHNSNRQGNDNESCMSAQNKVMLKKKKAHEAYGKVRHGKAR